jgi:hypothetical protein
MWGGGGIETYDCFDPIGGAANSGAVTGVVLPLGWCCHWGGDATGDAATDEERYREIERWIEG